MQVSLTEDRILYTDNHLIAVQKLAGEIVQGDKTGDEPLSDAVANYIKVKYNKPGDAFVGVIHRIDRPVSGLVLFARTSKGLSRMNELFREREVKKSYRALVEGHVQNDTGVLEHYLSKNETQNRSRASLKPAEGLLKCVLEFTVIKRTDRYTLVEVNPLTGRHHQIRVQLAAIGHPIKGDVKYGARRGNRDRSICLHAYSLKFTHPISGSEIKIEAELPENEAWAPVK
jgi:23S rRNA pseudouridine1911/1915/1917 synthase